MAQVEVVRDESTSRYVARVGGDRAAFIDYLDHPGAVELVHTQVRQAYAGAGVASSLVHQTLDLIRAADRKVVPTCPYVRSWIARHPDYADLVAAP